MKNIHSILVVFSILLFWQGQAYALCNVGDSVSVAWKGYWYAARVINTSPDQCLITYDGYDNSWNEWVDNQRISSRPSKIQPLYTP